MAKKVCFGVNGFAGPMLNSRIIVSCLFSFLVWPQVLARQEQPIVLQGGASKHEVRYKSEDAEVRAILYLPSSLETRHPAVVFCPGLTRDHESYGFLFGQLTKNGYVVLATDYRGQSLLKDDVDTIAALDYLQSLAYVDSARLGLVGKSRGGMCVLRVAAKDPRVKTVVSLVPPADLPRLMADTEHYDPRRYRTRVERIGLGDPKQNRAGYQALSAVAMADRITVPVLMVCGTGDLQSPPDHSYWMAEKMNAAGNSRVKVELIPGMSHYFSVGLRGYVFDQIAFLTLDWLERTLK